MGLFLFSLAHGLISIANGKVFCGLGNGNTVDLTDTGSQYVHPSTKQCNYEYVHPAAKQCSYSYTHPTTKQCTWQPNGLTATLITTSGTPSVNISTYSIVIFTYSGSGRLNQGSASMSISLSGSCNTIRCKHWRKRLGVVD